MKKYLLLTAWMVAAAFGAFADGDETGSYADWYTPATSFSQQPKTPYINYYDSSGNAKGIKVTGLTLDSNLTKCLACVQLAIEDAKMSASAQNAFYLAKAAISKAIYAELQAEKTQQEIKSLGASIETIFNLTTADRVDSNGATISSGKLEESMRAKLKSKKDALVSGGGGGSDIGDDDAPLKIVVTDYSYDPHEFEQISMNGNKSKMGLKGYKNLTPITAWTGDNWLGAITALGYIPFSSGYTGGEPNNLTWKSWAGFDSTIFKASDSDGKKGRTTLVGWDEGSTCAETMSKMLTIQELSDDRAKHAVLARYTTSGGTKSIHWVGIGDCIATGQFKPDEYSIVTNTALGALYDGKASLSGYSDALEAAGDGTPRIATVDGENDDLQWYKPTDFLDENTFELMDDNSAAATLYGWEIAKTAAGSGDERYIPNADPDEDGLNWTAVSDLFNDNVFSTDSEGKVIISGLNDIGDNDIMVISVKGEDTEQEVEGVKFDAGQFEKNSGKLILKGSADASATCSDPLNVMLGNSSDSLNRQRHRFLSLYTNGSTKEFHWTPITDVINSGVGVDEASITTNTANGALNAGKASLYGYADAVDSVDTVPYIPFEDGTGNLQWQEFDSFLDENEFDARASDGLIMLNGFGDADEDAGEEVVPYIPYVDGGGDLAWQGFDAFFSDNVFKKSETTGKILLNGTSESADKYSVLAIKTSQDGETQELGSFGFDNQSIDGQIGTASTIQLHNFASPTDAVSGKNFAEILTNRDVNITGLGVPIRVANGTGGKPEIKYATLAKITGIPAANVDDKTIEINKEDENNQYLQLYRSKGEGITLSQGQVYGISTDGKGRFLSLENPNDSLLTPSILIDYAGLSNGYIDFNLSGVKTIDRPFLAGGDGSQNYETYDVDSSCVIETHGDDGKSLQLNGYSSATDHSIPVKDASGEKPIAWVSLGDKRLLMGKADSAPTGLSIGASFDTENVSATPTLNVKGFTNGGNCSASLNDMLSKDSESSNRSHHQIMARYSTGSGTPSVHWIPITGTIGGGSPVDDQSITTNTANGAVTAGTSSLYGYALATTEQYAIPYKGASNMEWLAKPSGATAAAPKALIYNGSTLGWGTAGAGGAVDNVSITTNYQFGAVQDNIASIAGVRNATENSFLFKKQGNGEVGWFDPPTDNGAKLLAYNNGNYWAGIGSGLQFSSQGDVEVVTGDGIYVDNETGVNVLYDQYNGLALNNSGEITINYGGGLTVNTDTSQLMAYPDENKGIEITYDGKLGAKIGNGLKFDDSYGNIIVDYDASKGLDVVPDGSLEVKAGEGLSFDSDGSLKANGIKLETNEVTVVTDVTGTFDASSGSITLTLTRKKLQLFAFEDASESTETIMLPMTPVTVVTDSDYSTDTHVFKNNRKTLNVFSATDTTDDTVFTAVPHTSE